MKTLLTLLAVLVLHTACYSQGCSDAGFCSLSALRDQSAGNIKRQAISIGINYGLGEEKTSTFNPYLEYGIRVNEKWKIQAKLTSTYATGFLGSNANLGDLYTTVTHRVKRNSSHAVYLISGIKIPMTVSNDKYKGRPLPMDYQSSLGTFDYIGALGINLYQHWEFSAGLQIPFVQINKNSFFQDEYMEERVMSFPSTNNFRRKPDMLLRAGYRIQIQKQFILKPDLLCIYHLGEDKYEDRMGIRKNITGSSGITLNAALQATKTFNNHQFELIVATPLIVRKVRPDGLTRGLVVNLQYSFFF